MFNGVSPLWDLSLPPSLPKLDDDFLSLLQKQISSNNPQPQGRFQQQPVPNVTPPLSEDSSPSPSASLGDHDQNPTASGSRGGGGTGATTRSRSSARTQDDDHHKRKASEAADSDDDDDDQPQSKSQHTLRSDSHNGPGKKAPSNSRRKSGGSGNPDESRLLKRKEQNRAAQRAFRERKERHVKELEDKVSQLEEKTDSQAVENENLRELLTRLQTENLTLKQQQQQFTFALPSNGDVPANSAAQQSQSGSSSGSSPESLNLFGSPSNKNAGTTATSTTDSPQPFGTPSMFDAFGTIPVNNPSPSSSMAHFSAPLGGFGPMSLPSPASTSSQFGAALSLGFGSPFANNGLYQTPNVPYTTIAANPLFTSFREPTPSAWPGMGFNDFATSNGDVNMNGMTGNAAPGSMGLDDLFGGQFDEYNPFTAFAPPEPIGTVSPVVHPNNVSHTNGSTPSSVNNASGSTSRSGTTDSNRSDSSSNTSHHPTAAEIVQAMDDDVCVAPCTKDSIADMIAASEPSTFGPPVSYEPTPEEPENCERLRKMVKSKTLPRVEKSPQHIELGVAMKHMKKYPQLNEDDLDFLCSELAAKARCDGSRTVLEPQGVAEIVQSLQARK